MEGLSIRPLTLWSIGGHDVLLNATHDLLNSIVELSGEHNRELNGSLMSLKLIYFYPFFLA